MEKAPKTSGAFLILLSLEINVGSALQYGYNGVACLQICKFRFTFLLCRVPKKQ